MHQQLARTDGVAVKDVALFIGGDVHLLDEQLAVLDVAPAVLEVNLSQPQRFDLGAAQLDAGLIGLLHKIVMPRLSVDRDGFGSGCLTVRTSL